jgi:CheY-like chemotaxis protein
VVPVAAAPLPTVPSLHLLIAEDNDVNALILTRILRNLGHTSERVENGRLAVERVTTGDFDAVLMDLHMPDMDGEEATRHIRALPGTQGQTPIIAVTADVVREHRERVMAAGLTAFLAKPCKRTTVAAALEQALGPPSTRSGGNTPPATSDLHA